MSDETFVLSERQSMMAFLFCRQEKCLKKGLNSLYVIDRGLGSCTAFVLFIPRLLKNFSDVHWQKYFSKKKT